VVAILHALGAPSLIFVDHPHVSKIDQYGKQGKEDIVFTRHRCLFSPDDERVIASTLAAILQMKGSRRSSSPAR
jgi:hypothetical protein